MSKTTISYKDVAVGADEDAAVSATGNANYSHLDKVPFGASHPPIATLEPRSWVLDGRRVALDTQQVAFWSEQMSDINGDFITPPTITFTFNEQYSSIGLSITGDPAVGEYCSAVNIKWYQGDTLKSSKDFTPDSVQYFCEDTVEAWDKIVLTLNKTNKPRRRAKINMIIFGVLFEFGMDKIRDANITNEASLSGLSLPVSTLNFTLDPQENVNFLFQFKQPLEVKNNGNLLGVYYIDTTKEHDNIYKIRCQDAIGVLDTADFAGGDYISGVSAKQLLLDIIEGDFEVSVTVPDTTLYGILEKQSKRSAIQQVLFAWGAVATTDGSKKINVIPLGTVLKEIGEDRTFPPANVNGGAIVTSVSVTAHSYTRNGDGYDDTKTVTTITNPNVTATDKPNNKSVENATLISSHNVAAVAQKLYDFYNQRAAVSAKVVWGGEKLADLVKLPRTGEIQSNVCKMEILLSNTVVAGISTVRTGAE